METNTNLLVTAQNVTELSDRELIDLCKKYGSNARLWMRKFADLLPEVERRHLYKRRGCCSIYEFAAKYAGMNRNTTDQVLSLCRSLEDKPVLRSLLVECGWSKLRVVVSVATPETDEFWAEKTRTLIKGALELFVKDFRVKLEERAISQNNVALQFPKKDQFFPWEKTEPVKRTGDATFEALNERCDIQFASGGTGVGDERENLTFKLDTETKFRLEKLKQKLEKQRKEPLTYNQLLKAMLDQIEDDSEQGSVRSERRTETAQQANSRHIPAQINRELEEQYHGRCAFPGCNKPATHRHHTKRYALHRDHNSATIVPLCKCHHDLAHAGLIENEQDSPRRWRLSALHERTPWWDENNLVDRKVQEFKLTKV